MNATQLTHPFKRLLSKPYWWMRARLRPLRFLFGDLVKAFVMLLILKPAADYLPESWAFALARLFGRVNAVLPFYGRQTRQLVERSFSVSSKDARRVTGACLSRHFLDFTAARRYIRGRDDNVNDWQIREINAHIVEELRSSNVSYILATGHFNRKAHGMLSLQRIIPQQIIIIANPPIPKSLHPYILWLRAHYGQMLECIQRLRSDVKILVPGQSGLIKELVRSLSQPGNVLQMAVDAPWDSDKTGSFLRPFAGKKNKGFATGAARLARLAQCPIVLCHPYIDESDRITLHWVRVVQPPDRRDADADVAITNLLLDDIERAVGLRPDQYVMGFLGERRWNLEKQRWEE